MKMPQFKATHPILILPGRLILAGVCMCAGLGPLRAQTDPNGPYAQVPSWYKYEVSANGFYEQAEGMPSGSPQKLQYLMKASQYEGLAVRSGGGDPAILAARAIGRAILKEQQWASSSGQESAKASGSSNPSSHGPSKTMVLHHTIKPVHVN
jgi:hypothetical protein